LLVSGTITFTFALVISALGAESPAVYNACFVSLSCLSDISRLNFEAFFAILVAGVMLGVAGATQLLVSLRPSKESTGRA
jgi:hypothetical protein